MLNIQYREDRGFAVPYSENSSLETGDSVTNSEDEDLPLTPFEPSTASSSQNPETPAPKKLKHSDPFDDAILSKRFGEMSYNEPSLGEN